MRAAIPLALVLLCLTGIARPVCAQQAEESVEVCAADSAMQAHEALFDSVPASSADSVPETAPAIIPELPKPKVGAVDYDRDAPPVPAMHYYDKHGEPLETPVRFLAELDTVAKVKPGPVYPVFNGVTAGVNFFDAVLMAVGQRRASLDLWGDVSIHNWLFPVVECGLAWSDAYPDDGRFHYKLRATPYLRVGVNYNILYKSNPDYQFFLGLRGGWSTFDYDILGISAGSDYYKAGGGVDVKGLRATSFYGQAVAGLKVQLARGFTMGWSFRYGFNIHRKLSNPDYEPWFIPGCGTATPITATFSAGWTFGRKPAKTISPE